MLHIQCCATSKITFLNFSIQNCFLKQFFFQVEVNEDTLEVTTKGDISLFPEENKLEREADICQLRNSLASAKAVSQLPSSSNFSSLMINLSKAGQDLSSIKTKNVSELQRTSRLLRQNKMARTARIGKSESIEILQKEAQEMKVQLLSCFPACQHVQYR